MIVTLCKFSTLANSLIDLGRLAINSYETMIHYQNTFSSLAIDHHQPSAHHYPESHLLKPQLSRFSNSEWLTNILYIDNIISIYDTEISNMKHGSTTFLKIVIILSSLAVLTLCILIAYALIKDDVGGYRPIMMGMLIAAIPYFTGAYQTFWLLNNIDQKKIFTKSSMDALKIIKYCGIAIATLYGAGLPYIFIVADQDDAPGVILLGLIFTFAPIVIAVFAAIIERLVHNASNLKQENDLTV